ncbi:MAG TPA: AraC family transcriptional regulator [Bradyrhizobium sp.]|nr:AraC family transcriptional regulator [Bradyrhizobium sp.]
MLQSYPLFRSRNIDEVKAHFLVRGQDSRMELAGRRRRGEFVANVARAPDASLLYTRYDNPITMGFDASCHIHIGYQVYEVSQVVLEGKAIENGIHQSGCLVPDQLPWSVQNPKGFQVLLLRLGTDALRRKLAALLGAERRALDLRQPAMADPGGAARLRASVFDFAQELDVADRRFLPQLIATATEEICLRVLTELSEHVADAERAPAAPSALQLGHVEQYIVANFAEPLTVETLAEISGVSGRSVFSHFLSRYGCTPHAYLERIRLDMAHFSLPGCADQNAVALIALRCGFPSLAHFERAYRDRFGELPTLPPAARYRAGR